MKCLLLVITVVGVVLGAPEDEKINKDGKGFQDGSIEGNKNEDGTQIIKDDMQTHLHAKKNIKLCIFDRIDANGISFFRNYTLAPPDFSLREKEVKHLLADIIEDINDVDDNDKNGNNEYLSLINDLNKSRHQIKKFYSNENNIYESEPTDTYKNNFKYYERTRNISETLLTTLIEHNAMIFDAFNNTYYKYIINAPIIEKTLRLNYWKKLTGYQTHAVPYHNVVEYSKAIVRYCQAVQLNIKKVHLLLELSKINNEEKDPTNKPFIEESYEYTRKLYEIVNRMYAVLFENAEKLEYPAKNEDKEETNIDNFNNIESLHYHVDYIHRSMQIYLDEYNNEFSLKYATNILYFSLDLLSTYGVIPPPDLHHYPSPLKCD